MKIYLITNYAKLDGVLDLYKEERQAKWDIDFWHNDGKRGETKLLEIDYDGRIYDYERGEYKINFFEKRENNKEWATPYLDNECLENWGIKTKELLSLNN